MNKVIAFTMMFLLGAMIGITGFMWYENGNNNFIQEQKEKEMAQWQAIEHIDTSGLYTTRKEGFDLRFSNITIPVKYRELDTVKDHFTFLGFCGYNYLLLTSTNGETASLTFDKNDTTYTLLYKGFKAITVSKEGKTHVIVTDTSSITNR